MTTSKKYMLAGMVVAGVGTLYATYLNIDTEVVTDYIEKHKNKFLEIIEELVSIAMEILLKIINFIKKLILKISFQTKMALNF